MADGETFDSPCFESPSVRDRSVYVFLCTFILTRTLDNILHLYLYSSRVHSSSLFITFFRRLVSKFGTLHTSFRPPSPHPHHPSPVGTPARPLLHCFLCQLGYFVSEVHFKCKSTINVYLEFPRHRELTPYNPNFPETSSKTEGVVRTFWSPHFQFCGSEQQN